MSQKAHNAHESMLQWNTVILSKHFLAHECLCFLQGLGSYRTFSLTVDRELGSESQSAAHVLKHTKVQFKI